MSADGGKPMKLSSILAFGSVVAIVAACGGNSSLGSGDDNLGDSGKGGGGKGGASGSGQSGSSGTGGASGASGNGGSTAGGGGSGGYQPCAGLPCGAQCSVCDPNDKTCVSDAAIHYCSTNGE